MHFIWINLLAYCLKIREQKNKENKKVAWQIVLPCYILRENNNL